MKSSSRKIEPLRLSSKVKQELSASGVFTAAGANAILQKVVVEAGSETSRQRKSDLSASVNSLSILDDDDEEEQATSKTEKSVLGKLNASFTNFFTSSMENLRDELDSSTLAERRSDAKERNIAPKRTSMTFDKETTTIRTDEKSHRCREVMDQQIIKL